MNSIDRPARRAPSQHLPILAALAMAILVAPLVGSPARAGWTPETAVAGVVNTRPAIAIDAGDHLGVAWQVMSSAPGILFASDATGSWVTDRVSTGDDGSPDLVLDGAGKAHVVFVRDGLGLYYATNVTGTWVTTLLRSDTIPWSPSIAIDKLGKLHVAYSSEGFVPGIWYLTNASGVWVTTRLTTSTWDSEPSLVLDAANKVRIAFARYDPSALGIYVLSNVTGSWIASRATSGPSIDDYPALGIDAAGKLHVAAVRYDADWNASLLYLTNETGAWATTAVGLPTGLTETGSPALGFDGAGEPEIVAGLYGDDAFATLYRFSSPAMGTSEALVTPEERSSGFPDVLRDGTGRLTVAYRDSWHKPGLYLHREDPDQDALIAASAYLGSPVIEGRDDRRYLVVDRYAPDPSDGTTLALKDAGTWSDGALDPGQHGAPDLNVASSASGTDLYVANPRRLLWDEGAGWQTRDFAQKGDEASLAIDFDSSTGIFPLVAYTTDTGIRLLDRGVESQLTVDGNDRNPDLAADVYGPDPYEVLAFMRGDDLYATNTTGDVVLDVVSDTSWTVDDADAGVGPTLSLPGPAQRVCLTDTSPPGCPDDAVRYGHNGTWGADLSSIPGAAWIWAPGITGATEPADNDTYTFTKTFNLSGLPSAANIKIAADDFAQVRVNGQLVGTVNTQALSAFDIKAYLVLGTNTIVVTGINGVACGGFSCPYSQNPGGVVFGASITYHSVGALPPGARTPWTAPQLVDSTSAWDPAVAISEHSGTFIAYDRHSTNPGIYLARRSAGATTWTLTRLSRSWADSRPAIVTRPSASGNPTLDTVYVAWVRECSGAAPGIYLARGDVGSTLSVTRIVASCDVTDVSMDVVNGKVVLAYDVGSVTISAMSETTTAATGPAVVGPAAVGRSGRPVDDADGASAPVGAPSSDLKPAGPEVNPPSPAGRPGGRGHVPATP